MLSYMTYTCSFPLFILVDAMSISTSAIFLSCNVVSSSIILDNRENNDTKQLACPLLCWSRTAVLFCPPGCILAFNSAGWLLVFFLCSMANVNWIVRCRLFLSSFINVLLSFARVQQWGGIWRNALKVTVCTCKAHLYLLSFVSPARWGMTRPTVSHSPLRWGIQMNLIWSVPV